MSKKNEKERCFNHITIKLLGLLVLLLLCAVTYVDEVTFVTYAKDSHHNQSASPTAFIQEFLNHCGR